jgi:Hypothetical protein (DUF2513)
MKRDMDLVRKILMVCSDHEHGHAPPNLQIDGYTDEEIGYHAHIMEQAGLVRAFDVTDSGSLSPEAQIVSLTWEGHDFLEASRDEGLWAKAKQAAGSTGGMALGVLKSVLIDLATHAAKKAAGLP